MQADTERLTSIYRNFQCLWALENAPLHGSFALLWSGEAQAAAARIAGACSLLALEDAVEARQAVRSGAADFLVTSLDEALRILRTELRRKAPVGVCLRAPVGSVLQSCVERGVQPDYLGAAQPILEVRGARRIPWHRHNDLNKAAEQAHWLRHAPSTLGRVDARQAGLLLLTQPKPEAG